jgi:hypothetical protein
MLPLLLPLHKTLLMLRLALIMPLPLPLMPLPLLVVMEVVPPAQILAHLL